MTSETRHVHLIGIGGTGLSAIARVLLESGYQVSGSDRQLSTLAKALQSAGVAVYTGHNSENVAGADLVIRSSAIPDDNVEVQAARLAGIPVLKRAEFLGELLSGRIVIAVAGTHGKTTTTAMIAWMLAALGQDPSYIIGSVSANLGVNAHAGKGPNFVIEADEYDRMFLGLAPQVAVVTNIEHDHPDCYPTPEDFYQAFKLFMERLLPEGLLVACSDDRGAARLLAEARAEGRRVVSYGLVSWLGRPQVDFSARQLEPNAAGGYHFAAARKAGRGAGGLADVEVDLQVPGQHNVSNALAALAVADELGLPLDQAAQALGDYRGAGRRFELRGEAGGIAVIDDYAHHPTEIRATLSAARARYPNRALWVVWQPHTFSRTSTLLDGFAAAFEDADHVLVTAIYAAREAEPADGFSAQRVVAMMQHPDVHYIPELPKVTGYLLEHLEPGNVLLVMSAGDADQVSAQVLAGLQDRRSVENV
jgi:UDP-N-acetylmuramate--alanine ligase